jgi:hypothetical protein
VQYTSRISEYVGEFVSGKDIQMTLCVYPSKMADWQVKCKNKLLIRKEIKKTIRNGTNSSVANCHAASTTCSDCLLFPEQPLSAILCWGVIFTVVIVVVCTCVIRCVIVVVYTCYKVCYCCGVHMCYKVCYCGGVHMLLGVLLLWCTHVL